MHTICIAVESCADFISFACMVQIITMKILFWCFGKVLNPHSNIWITKFITKLRVYGGGSSSLKTFGGDIELCMFTKKLQILSKSFRIPFVQDYPTILIQPEKRFSCRKCVLTGSSKTELHWSCTEWNPRLRGSTINVVLKRQRDSVTIICDDENIQFIRFQWWIAARYENVRHN